MNSVFKFQLVTLTILTCVYEAFAILPSPQNVTLHAMNTQYILKWDWDRQATGNKTVTFTAQYIHKYKIGKKNKSWTTVCNETWNTQCDFTSSRLHYQGIFVLRVQANCAKEHSQWVERNFCPESDAALGPPSNVEVTAGISLLRILISDPLTSDNTSMKDTLVPNIFYLVQFWKHNTATDRISLKTSTNEVTLPKLEAWTEYCVKVQSHEHSWNRTSHFSPTQCQETEGRIPSWLILLVLCIVGAPLSCAAYTLFRVIKSTFFPSSQLPASMFEYMRDSSPCSDRPYLLTPESEVEVCCEKLHVFPRVVLPEIHAPPAPPAPDADASSHSRQGSRDSGMYSTEEGSGQLAASSAQGKMAEMRADSGIGRMAAAPGGDCWD